MSEEVTLALASPVEYIWARCMETSGFHVVCRASRVELLSLPVRHRTCNFCKCPIMDCLQTSYLVTFVLVAQLWTTENDSMRPPRVPCVRCRSQKNRRISAWLDVLFGRRHGPRVGLNCGLLPQRPIERTALQRSSTLFTTPTTLDIVNFLCARSFSLPPFKRRATMDEAWASPDSPIFAKRHEYWMWNLRRNRRIIGRWSLYQ